MTFPSRALFPSAVLETVRKPSLMAAVKDAITGETRMAKSINVTVSPIMGKEIREVCGDVKELSEFLGREVDFKFNGVPMTTANQSINDMVDGYMRARRDA